MTPELLADLFLEIKKLHDFTIEQHGGLSGFRDAAALHFAVARPWMTAGGEEIFNNHFQKAAAIAESIVRGHPFNDGNHRSGLAAAHIMLGMLGLRLVASHDEQREEILKLGADPDSLDAFARWLERNSIPRSRVTP